MSPMKTPLQTVKEQFGGKEKLVDKILGLIERGEEETDALRKRLLAVSNRKLLKLQRNAEAIKTKYGSKEKLVAAVAEMMGRAKDKDFVKKLGEYTPNRLLDMATSLSRKAGGAAQAAAAKAKPKKASAKKTPAKKAASSHTAAKSE